MYTYRINRTCIYIQNTSHMYTYIPICTCILTQRYAHVYLQDDPQGTTNIYQHILLANNYLQNEAHLYTYRLQCVQGVHGSTVIVTLYEHTTIQTILVQVHLPINGTFDRIVSIYILTRLNSLSVIQTSNTLVPILELQNSINSRLQ